MHTAGMPVSERAIAVVRRLPQTLRTPKLRRGMAQTSSSRRNQLVIEEFSFHSRFAGSHHVDTGDHSAGAFPDDAVVAAWNRILARVLIAIKKWERDSAGLLSSEDRGYAADISFTPGWVCLTVTHPAVDGPTHIEVMHKVAKIIEQETRRMK